LNKYLKRGRVDKSKNAPYFLDKLGCSFEEFKLYLESKFEKWMNWDNYGKYNGEINYGWDIDHIIPLSSAKIEEEIYKLSHYTNLQPLCSKFNRDIKKDKIISPLRESEWTCCGDEVEPPHLSSSVNNNYSFTGLVSFSKLTK